MAQLMTLVASVLAGLVRSRTALTGEVARLRHEMREASSCDSAPKHLIRDNDGKFGDAFRQALRSCGIRDRPIAPRSPWQNGYVERVIGTIRRECLVIIWNEAHLCAVLRAYTDYYNANRTHLSLGKDAPEGRMMEFDGEIIASRVLGGLHQVYGRCTKAKDSNIR